MSTKPPCILKYAPHPHRPGYILLLTDLTGVYLESLLAPSIPSRLAEISRHSKGKGKKGRHTTGSEDDDVIAQSEKALAGLQKLMRSGQLNDAEVELRDHDYHVSNS